MIGCYASAAFGEYVDPDIGEDETDTMELCSTIFAIVGKFGVSGTFGVIYVHASELYPTPVRSIGVGIASAMGRVGGILAPLVASLGGFLPMIIFGSLGVLQVSLGEFFLLITRDSGYFNILDAGNSRNSNDGDTGSS